MNAQVIALTSLLRADANVGSSDGKFGSFQRFGSFDSTPLEEPALTAP